ncbi:MAG: SDR family NAD(P)-dependent oxidoreductase, partial [Candidatus Aminicenantes bacterium]
MDDRLKSLYHRVKEGKISQEDAVRQIKAFNARHYQGINPYSSSRPGEAHHTASSPNTGTDAGGLPEKVQAALKQTVSQLLKVKTGDIDTDAHLNDYGFDLVTLTQFANQLNIEYGLELAPTIFPQHPTLRRFTGYLLEEYKEIFIKRFPPGALETPSTAEESQGIPGIGQDIPREKAVYYFKKLLSSVINLPVQRIEADAPMEKYGIDSIMVMKLTDQLEQTFGSLSKTLFFEYQNIRELTGYFLEYHRDQLMELLEIEEKTKVSPRDAGGSAAGTGPVKSALTSHQRPRFVSTGNGSRDKKTTGALDIAIIGLSGRYPQAGNIREFWENLRDGKDCITEIPGDRWDHNLYFDEDKNKPGKTYSKWGGFLEGVEQFDPLFFNISPQEAAIMDPQERLFLECVHETLEDAGYTRETPGLHQGPGPGGNVGVYVGVMYEEYQLYGAQQTIQGRPMALSGNSSSIANRVSYFYNFHGPSMAVNTMCSSSLTAIHLACHSLQRGECDMAVAGGVNVSIHPNKYLLLGQGKFASSKGRCESFGQGGDGYVPGEGVGAVLIKPLSQAIAHGDHIYGIIKASAINHGGKTNGYFVPNPNAQASVIAQAFKQAGISPRAISYIEAHGTGTILGDPIEITGLTKAFQQYTKDKQFCAIGSAKSNIGHCESAAGIAGVTKVLLQLQHRQLAPSLHSEVLNPNIDFSNTPFVVQQELAEWKPPKVESNGETREYPRIAGISSFGAGGSNAHLLIQEYSPTVPGDREPLPMTITTENPAIILLSAKNEERLREQVQNLLAVVRQQQFTDANLADIAYTLQVGREAMEERLAVMVGSIKELREKLAGFLEGRDDIENLYRGQVKRNKEALAVFAADEDLQEVIDKWVQHRKYEKLPVLWVKGLVFDWNKLSGGGKPYKPRRISLPTYPFAREYCWVPGLDTRVSKTAAGSTGSSTHHPLLLHPCWQEQALVPGNKAPEYAQHLVILCEPGERWEDGKMGKGRLAHPVKIIDLHSQQEEIQQRFQDYALRVFEEIKRVLKDKPGGKVLIQVVVSNRDEQQLFSGLSGLLKTAQLENPNLISQLIEMDPGENSRGLIEKLEESSRCPHDNRIRYQEGKPWTVTWSDNIGLISPLGPMAPPWRDRGVYLITGGLGGLGLIFAGEILQQVKDAALVLTGRSPRRQLNREKQAKLKELQALAAQVQYRQVDVSQKEAVVSLIRDIRENFGSLNGIIHSAGVIRDNFIIRKTGEEFQEVLAPKVQGLVHLDRASKDLALDFFIFFSSAAGVTGNIGQADYSVANAFMDAYAGYRNALVASKKRQGQTLSINWPLWKEGGMHIDEETQKIMRQKMGIIPMQTPTGIRTFYQALASGKDQVMVLTGDRSRLREALLKTVSYVPSPPAQVSIPPVEPGLLKDKTLHQLKVLLGETIQLGTARIDAGEPLENYGIDSIMITRLNQKLTGIFGELSKTLFYEYRTLEALAGYLTADYPQECMQWTGVENYKLQITNYKQNTNHKLQITHNEGQGSSSDGVSSSDLGASLFLRAKSQEPRANLPIAIIGMSGRFPGANTPGQYWENLLAGKNSITEIPPDRWDWKEYYHEDPNQAAALRKSYSKWGGFLDEFHRFDPLFFNMTPREAENIDPQERLFLEECWKALEDAGYAPSKLSPQLRQKTGVFGGITKQGFNLYGVETGQHFPSTSFSSLVNRVSYFMDLQGPSIPIDTMCSSSLAAIHEACEYIRGGRGAMAIAGGVNLYLHPSTY